MKLYDLVQFKKNISTFYNVDAIQQEINKLSEKLSSLGSGIDPQYLSYLHEQINSLTTTSQNIRNQRESINGLLAQLNGQIEETTKRLFSQNYEHELSYNVIVNNIRTQREMHMPEAARELVEARLKSYCDWHYAGLEIGCRYGDWTNELVGCDPLYIYDVDQAFIDTTVSKFNTAYQRRLRPYVNKDHKLDMMPHTQFGFIFSWNFFNHLGLETIKQYLIQAYDLLKPGGCMMFSYNDGDQPNGASYAECFAASYIPQSLLVPLCESLGFEILDNPDFDSGVVSWLELKKPGELKTSKASQALGEIKLIDN